MSLLPELCLITDARRAINMALLTELAPCAPSSLVLGLETVNSEQKVVGNDKRFSGVSGAEGSWETRFDLKNALMKRARAPVAQSALSRPLSGFGSLGGDLLVEQQEGARHPQR